MSRKNGGIIGPANTPVGGLFKGVAGGVWRMNDVLNFVNNNQWPKTPQNIENALRFDSASSDYLNQTLPNNDASIDKWTYSGWIKKNSNGVETYMFHFWQDGSNRGGLRFNSDDTLFYYDRIGGTDIVRLKTNAVFRDPSAWYHILVKVDKSIATPNTQIYVNGIEQSLAEDSDYTQGEDGKINEAITLYINNYDGSQNIRTIMMSEVCWISGQALDPTSFGETDTATGIWKPKKIGQIANAGDNSFYLDFKDSSSLGKDQSGLGNNFTVNNLTSIDQTTDTCVENFATYNPLITFYPTYVSTLSDGNLTATRSDNGGNHSTIMPTQGKWYAEFKCITKGSGVSYVGAIPYDKITDNEYNAQNNGVAYRTDGTKYINGTGTAYGDTWGAGDIISIALNLDDGEAVFYKNGTAQNSGTAITGFTYDSPMAIMSGGGGSTWKWSANFGNPPYSISSGNSDANGYGNFEYSVPSGYYALNSKNLAEYG